MMATNAFYLFNNSLSEVFQSSVIPFYLYKYASFNLIRLLLEVNILNLDLQVDHHRKDILNYMIFLRITPLLPNWFINVTAPVLNVPLWPFFLGTFIGKY